jgi:hypothetical protein
LSLLFFPEKKLQLAKYKALNLSALGAVQIYSIGFQINRRYCIRGQSAAQYWNTNQL